LNEPLLQVFLLIKYTNFHELKISCGFVNFMDEIISTAALLRHL